ncbi:MAG: sodium/hydrogen exchanger family/TrkA domain protein [Candidatus Binatia bacterium]|nr:MAG: sodium/hydrogen exchanger family/TrkA domain protein [Candidatus Binatia bacterium]
MPEHRFLADFLLILVVALPIAWLFTRLQLPSLVGFLLAGAVIGPHGIGLIDQSQTVSALAEIGVILLLFVVGVELSFGQVAQLGSRIVVAGIAQILATAAVIALAVLVVAGDLGLAVLAALTAVHSSTAIPLKVLSDRKQIDALHGRICLGIALAQDLSLLPMMLVLRGMASSEPWSWQGILRLGIQSVLALGIVLVAARLVLPAVLRRVVAMRSREVFTGTIVVVALGTAWLAGQFGLSLAVGALIAGLVISESEYAHAVMADVLPFRDTLNSIFFISIGMLVPLGAVAADLWFFFGTATALLAAKAAILFGIVRVLYRSGRVAFHVALALSSMSELAFVLLRAAMEFGLVDLEQYERFVAVAVLTMLPTPFLMAWSEPIWSRLERLKRQRSAATAAQPQGATPQVVIIGFGLNGENLARVLRATGVPFVVIELDPRRVQSAREQQARVLYGDATRPQVLRAAGIEHAQVVVVAISDAVATRRIVAQVRHLAPQVPVIVRTRYVAEIEELRRLGATEVIPEEFETSVEIFARVLRLLRVPRNIINAQIDLIRREGYSMLRGLELPRQTLAQLDAILAATTTESFLVTRDSPLCGRTLRDLRLRKETGATVIAIVRDGKPITNPEPDEPIRAGDILVLVGSHEQLDHALEKLSSPFHEGESSC